MHAYAHVHPRKFTHMLTRTHTMHTHTHTQHTTHRHTHTLMHTYTHTHTHTRTHAHTHIRTHAHTHTHHTHTCNLSLKHKIIQLYLDGQLVANMEEPELYLVMEGTNVLALGDHKVFQCFSWQLFAGSTNRPFQKRVSKKKFLSNYLFKYFSKYFSKYLEIELVSGCAIQSPALFCRRCKSIVKRFKSSTTFPCSHTQYNTFKHAHI